MQYQSLKRLEGTSAAILVALSRQTIDGLAHALEKDFERASFDIDRVDHAAIDRFDLATVAAGLRARAPGDQLTEVFYLWSENGPRGRDTAVVQFPAGPFAMSEDDLASEFTAAGAEAEAIKRLVDTMAAGGQQWGIGSAELNGRPQALVVHALFHSPGRERMTSFIGYRVDLYRLRTEYLPGIVAPYLDAARNDVSLAPLRVWLVGQNGRVLFESRAAASAQFLEERELPLLFHNPRLVAPVMRPATALDTWRLRVGYGDQTVSDLARRSTDGHRLLLFTLVLALAASVVFTIRMAMAELHVADLKSRFIANVSHELKTPLSLISLFAETLRLGRVRSVEQAHEYYEILHNEAGRLTGLINGILDFSRLESGLGSDRRERIDVDALVRRVVTRFELEFARQGFTVDVQPAPVLLWVSGDPEALELALANLVSNAIKYSGDSRHIGLRIARDDYTVRVSVSDRGIGVPRKFHARIFEAFFRVHAGHTDAPPGCGLGLAIVGQVMRAHGGRVEVQSEEGRGSVFTLVFPMTEARAYVHADSGDRRRAPDVARTA